MPDPSPTPKILQFKVWLIGLSPMIWRWVQVPDSILLRELRGVIQPNQHRPHAGAEAFNPSTFQPDHSMGADHLLDQGV